MVDYKPSSMPIDTCAKMSVTDGAPVSDTTDFSDLACALHLTFTKLDISYGIQQVCLHMHNPRDPHLATLECILRYIYDTLHHGLLLWSFTLASTRLVVLTLASPPQAMQFFSRIASSPGPPNVSLCGLHTPPYRATLVYYDNISVIYIYMSSKPVQHQRTEHIEIDLHFVQEHVIAIVCVLQVLILVC